MIAILEDDERRSEAMRQQLVSLFPQTTLILFDNAPDMIQWLRDNLYLVNLLCLDHDLGPTRQRDGDVFDPGTGRDVVDFICTYQPVCPVIIHSSNGPAAQGMQFALTDAGWQNERVRPMIDLEWIATDWSTTLSRMLNKKPEE